MKLYIVRHGIALDVGEQGIRSDEVRTLSPKGRSKVRQVANGLAALGIHPRRVATSPLPRAEETAKILVEVLCPNAPLEICDFLRPRAAARDLEAWLHRCGSGPAMIVGHMPDCAEIASDLVCKNGSAEFVFKKAGVCCVNLAREIETGAGRVEWILQPKQSCALAAAAGG